MIRVCNGDDPNLARFPHEDDIVSCPAPKSRITDGDLMCCCPVVVCRCGRVFDDVFRSVIYPHRPV